MGSGPRPSVTVRIRQAIPADKGPVLEFCRNTWPGGDYIPDVWDDWLRDKKGRLIVAVAGGKPVGVAHATLQTKEVAWLEGVRVHPSYRGQGIAGRLSIALSKFAVENRALVTRLCTGSKNKASRRHLDKVGFNILRVFQRLDSVKGLKHQPSRVARPRKYQASLWKWIRSRRELELFKEMYSDGWTWYPLNARSFQRLSDQRGVLQFGHDPPTSCSLFSAEEGRFTLGFAAGAPEEIVDHARYLRYLLWKENKERVRALIPLRSRFIDSFEDAGYEKSGKILVYEKPLKPTGQVKN